MLISLVSGEDHEEFTPEGKNSRVPPQQGKGVKKKGGKRDGVARLGEERPGPRGGKRSWLRGQTQRERAVRRHVHGAGGRVRRAGRELVPQRVKCAKEASLQVRAGKKVFNRWLGTPSIPGVRGRKGVSRAKNGKTSCTGLRHQRGKRTVHPADEDRSRPWRQLGERESQNRERGEMEGGAYKLRYWRDKGASRSDRAKKDCGNQSHRGGEGKRLDAGGLRKKKETQDWLTSRRRKYLGARPQRRGFLLFTRSRKQEKRRGTCPHVPG